MKIARVFPRRTNATPKDDLVFVGTPGLFPPEVDEVHISVTFSWDMPLANHLLTQWGMIAPAKIGGPATGMRGEEFNPGFYLKQGYVITSRGCPNKCWFCDVPKREGKVREFPIREGWNILDDNLLACSESHIFAVIEMLRQQKNPAEFTGGLEAARFTPIIAEAIRSIKPKQFFFAYDEPEDWEPLVEAANLCWHVGFTKQAHRIRTYVLIGYPKDTMPKAEQRLNAVLSLGVIPMAMLWRDKNGKTDPIWRRFQREWARPILIAASAFGYPSATTP